MIPTPGTLATILRVETPRGAGLYIQSEVALPPGLSQFSADHPSPADDEALVRALGWDRPGAHCCLTPDHIFGFSSPAQLRLWLWDESWTAHLDERGMRVRVYSARSAWVGTTQAIFLRSTATHTHTLSLREL